METGSGNGEDMRYQVTIESPEETDPCAQGQTLLQGMQDRRRGIAVG
jgi:hypothetical protein